MRSAEVQVSYEQHIRSIDDLLQFTNATGFQYLHTDRIQADSTLAGWLNLRVGIECIHLHGIRYHRRTALPYCLGEVYRRASWQGLPQGFARMEDALRHVMEKEFEQRIGKIEQSLSAVAMTEEQAHELKVPADTPGFRSVRRYFDLKGRLRSSRDLHQGRSSATLSVTSAGSLLRWRGVVPEKIREPFVVRYRTARRRPPAEIVHPSIKRTDLLPPTTNPDNPSIGRQPGERP